MNIVYRNGQKGRLLCEKRKNTIFSVLTMRDIDDSIIHHMANGRCNFENEPDSEWDIIKEKVDLWHCTRCNSFFDDNNKQCNCEQSPSPWEPIFENKPDSEWDIIKENIDL